MEFELGSREIMILRQEQSLPVRLEGARVVAPLGKVAWKGLEAIGMQIVRAVSAIMDLPDEALGIDEFSGLSAPLSPVGIVIVGQTGEFGDAALKQAAEIQIVAQAYLTGIQQGGHVGQNELLETFIDSNSAVGNRLREQIAVDLPIIGGKVLKTHMVLECGTSRLVLSGTLGKKLPIPRPRPGQYELVGRVVGMHSVQKSLGLLTDDAVEVTIECDPDRFAHRMRNAIHTDRRFSCLIMRDTDGRGCEQQVLIDVEEIVVPLTDRNSLI